MPVFFYVDPEIMENPRLATSDHIVLSYTFFETQEEEVDKFLETLEKERNDDLEKARQMQQRRGDNVTTNVKFLLERARPGLSQHTVTKNPKAPSTEPAEKDKGKWVSMFIIQSDVSGILPGAQSWDMCTSSTSVLVEVEHLLTCKIVDELAFM